MQSERKRGFQRTAGHRAGWRWSWSWIWSWRLELELEQEPARKGRE